MYMCFCRFKMRISGQFSRNSEEIFFEFVLEIVPPPKKKSCEDKGIRVCMHVCINAYKY